jgi:hypothetical protein
VGRHPGPVGPATDEVVEPQREDEGQPVDGKADRETTEPADAGDRRGEERTEDERDEDVARGRDAPERDDDLDDDAPVRGERDDRDQLPPGDAAIRPSPSKKPLRQT